MSAQAPLDVDQPTITMGPTLTNPEALHTVEELRLALHEANTQLLGVSQSLHAVKSVLTTVARDVSVIVVAHLKKDSDALVEALDAFCRDHVRSMSDDSAGARGVH